MAFGLEYIIESVFDSSGFEEAQSSMKNLNDAADGLGLSTSELNDRINALDMSYDEASGRFKDANNQFMSVKDAMGELGSEQAAVAAAANEMGESQEFIQEQLSRTNMVMHENQEGAQQFRDMTTGAFKDSAEASDKMSDQLERFEFEALSAMFAAMAVSRTVQDLTDPAMESAGVFEVISDTLEVFFLPAALMVLDIVLFLQDAFLGLPKPIRKFIGILAVVIIIIGKIIGALSILVLNTSLSFGAIISAGGTLVGYIASAAGAIAGAFSTLGSLIVGAISTIVGAISLPIVAIAAVIAAIIGFALAWKDNLFGIRQKVGKFVQFVGKHFKTIAKIMFLPLEPLNQIIKAINKLTGKSLPTVDDVLNDVGDSIEEMGKGFEESGKKMDKMKKKAPDKKKQGFLDKFMPDIGGKKSEAKGSKKNGGDVQNNFKNKFEIKGASSMDETELARKIGRRQKEVQDKTVRKR